MSATSARRADGGTRPSETRTTTTGNLALAPPIGQPILTGSRAVPNNAPLIKRLLNIRLDDHVAKLILVTAGAYCNPWAGADGGVCLAANRTMWELAEVSRATFYRKWEFLKALGLVVVRRRGRQKGGEGMTAETIIQAAPIRPTGFRSAQRETFRSAQPEHPKDLEQGSISLDPTESSSPNAAARTTRARAAAASTTAGPRHVCECGHSWPAEWGDICNGCWKRIGEPPTPQTRREVERTGRMTVGAPQEVIISRHLSRDLVDDDSVAGRRHGRGRCGDGVCAVAG